MTDQIGNIVLGLKNNVVSDRTLNYEANITSVLRNRFDIPNHLHRISQKKVCITQDLEKLTSIHVSG